MSYYETTVLRVGPDAAMMADGDVLILFGDPVPAALEEVSVVHRPGGPPSATLEAGDVLDIGGTALRVAAVGNRAADNLAELGHVVLYGSAASGSGLLPGAVHVEGRIALPDVGASIRFDKPPTPVRDATSSVRDDEETR